MSAVQRAGATLEAVRSELARARPGHAVDLTGHARLSGHAPSLTAAESQNARVALVHAPPQPPEDVALRLRSVTRRRRAHDVAGLLARRQAGRRR